MNSLSEAVLFQNQKAEKNALASILLGYPGNEQLIASLVEDHFVYPVHARIFHAIKEKGPSVSSVEYRDADECMEIIDISPSGSPETCIKTLENAKSIRDMGHAIQLIDLDNVDCVNNAKEDILKVGTSNEHETYSVKELGLRAVERWEKKFTDARAAYRLGIPLVDDILRIRSGNVVVINARPKSGKTWMMTNIANHLSRRHKVLFISAEMHPDDLYTRLASKITESDMMTVEFSDLMSDGIKKKISHWGSCGDEINSRNLDIVNARGIGFGKLISILYQAVFKKYDIVLIDYIQRIVHKGQDRRIQVEEISRGISNVAAKNDITFIVASQAGRGARNADRTQAHHSKEAGAIEEDSDLILSMTKEETDKPTIEAKVTIDIVQRNGLSGVAAIKMNFATGAMEEWHDSTSFK